MKDFNFTGTEFPGTNHYTYAMDEYGNLLGEQKVYANPWAPSGMSVAVDAATNRLSGRPHDDLGNLTQVEGPDGATLNLDYLDQGHVARVTGGSGGEYRYYYDADGKRRLKAKGPQAACTGYSLSFYEGEDLVCQVDAGDAVQPDAAYQSKYLLTDHLGTTRAELTVDAQGSPRITQNYDTMPYGELLDPPANPMESILFTGKQRDPESGLYCLSARFYCSDQGRWNSPDHPLIDIQIDRATSWNLYTYVGSNPLAYIDKKGSRKARAIAKSDCIVGYILPSHPSELDHNSWRPDYDFNKSGNAREGSSQWIDGENNRLRFDPKDPHARPKTNQGKDHWHYNDEKKHLFPGDTVPDPVPFPEPDKNKGKEEAPGTESTQAEFAFEPEMFPNRSPSDLTTLEKILIVGTAILGAVAGQSSSAVPEMMYLIPGAVNIAPGVPLLDEDGPPIT